MHVTVSRHKCFYVFRTFNAHSYGEMDVNTVTKYLPKSEKSSTRIISCIRFGGERFKILWTVRSKTDQASLWRQIITLVLGRSFG